MIETDKSQGWHMKKEISYAHLVSTAMLVLSLLGGGATVLNRISTLEVQQNNINSKLTSLLEAQARRDASQDAEIRRISEETREDLKDINKKLDRLIERL